MAATGGYGGVDIHDNDRIVLKTLLAARLYRPCHLSNREPRYRRELLTAPH